MPRYRLTVEYNGSLYIGWQKQQGSRSIQQSLEDAVTKFCGEEAEVVGAGRTDAGVHAIAQAAHVDLARPQDPYNIMHGLNFHLFGSDPNNGISVLQAEEVPDDFHARFSAVMRHYRYRIVNRRARLALEAGRAWQVIPELDVRAMHDAAQHLVGHHDFTSFRDSQCQAKSALKTLDRLEVSGEGEYVIVEAGARSFLHHQVRNMVGTLSLVGTGKWKPQDVRTALEAKDRTKAGPTAPADGLYLVAVDY